MKILIVKLSAIGDVIHTLPALNALRTHFHGAHITWLVEAAASDLVIGHRALDRVIVSHRKAWIKQLKGPRRREAWVQIKRFVCELRDTRYDMVIDFQSLLKSGVLVWLARGTHKIGFDKGMQHQEHSHLFLNRRIPPVDMDIHALDRGLMLVESMGVVRGPVTYGLPVPDSDRTRVDHLLTARGIEGLRPLVAMNPVALWETKLWRNDRFAALADRLAVEQGVDVVFTGGLNDGNVIADIGRKMSTPCVDLSGRTTLKMLAALYQRSALLVTTDTGPMHLAAAVQTPVVALFGPTAPWRTGPYGKGHRVIRTAPDCSPCFKRQCDRHRCRCMTDIDVERVFSAVVDCLKALQTEPS